MIAAISYKPIPLFEVGPLSLSLHGVFAAAGFAAGAVLMIRAIRARRFDQEAVQSVLTWALIAALLGARLFTVPAHLGDAGYGLGDVVGLAGDFSILGGYAGGVIGGVLRLRMLGMNVPVHLDFAAAGMAIGAVVGRIGDLALVEHLGSPTSFFLGYTVKPGYDLAPQHQALECTVESAVDGIPAETGCPMALSRRSLLSQRTGTRSSIKVTGCSTFRPRTIKPGDLET